ncbi:MAG: hypothetical protein IJE77_01335 [Thermoguttaceae bacterium]|nr:hypothetical protein [Thermoguttaceae bacterium]
MKRNGLAALGATCWMSRSARGAWIETRERRLSCWMTFVASRKGRAD